MKSIFFILFTFSTLYCCTCKDNPNCHASVNIVNKSNNVIYFQDGYPKPEIGYNPLQSGEYFKLVSGASKRSGIGGDRGCYEDLFTENNNKLYYLIFDEQVLQNNTLEQLIANDMVLKRYSFTLQEMQAANWTIIYTGN